MGVYLSKPVKDKISSNFENKFLKCGASSMQGWRMSHEDAHNCCLDFDSEVSLFAVYDGHGGAEVAEYASKQLPNKIKETEAYKKGDFETALENAFLEFDSTLVTEPVLEELKSIASAKEKTTELNSETENETEEDDVQGLREEARMPLADVIAKYSNGNFPKTPALRRIRGESSKSPYLRARPSSSGSSADSEVTSSSSSNSNPEVITNGVSNEVTPEVNGEKSNDEEEASASGKAVNECEEVSSSSAVNGENAESVSSSERLSAKRAAAKMYKSLLTTAMAAAAADDSDSDENYESSNAVADTSTPLSSDEDDTENGDEEIAEDETDEDDEDDNDDDDDDDDDDEEEEAEEEQEEDLSDTSLKENEKPGNDSGCTAVVSLVTRDRVIVANAGDSRAVLCRKGEAVDLSVDHKPEDPIELKRITAAGGKVTADGRVNGGLNLSRALGDHMYKKRTDLPPADQMITALPDIKSVELREGEDEFVVLACDGIWNSMSSQEVVDFIRPLIAKGETLSSICEKLFENCLAEDTLGDGTGCDNMTCVIVHLFPQSDKQLTSKRKCEETDSTSEETKRKKVETECENV